VSDTLEVTEGTVEQAIRQIDRQVGEAAWRDPDPSETAGLRLIWREFVRCEPQAAGCAIAPPQPA
jgi:hypothetical protein